MFCEILLCPGEHLIFLFPKGIIHIPEIRGSSPNFSLLSDLPALRPQAVMIIFSAEGSIWHSQSPSVPLFNWLL